MPLAGAVEYGLSPMQEGMLFHCVAGAEDGAYVGQVTCPLPDTLDESAFERAWREVMARHAILRTSFEWEGLPQPAQRVHDDVDIGIERHDWRQLDADAQEQHLDAERRKPLDLRAPPVMRLSLCRRAADSLFVWTQHHILLDGRARVIVLDEVAQLYDAYVRGVRTELLASPSYREYLAWLATQDSDALAERWSALLGAFTPPPPLVLADGEGGQGFGRQRVPVTPQLHAALQRASRALGVTSSILVQCAWAVLLSRYTGHADAVFGVTRSCRRSAFAAAPSIVGVLMNTLSHRLRVDEDRPFAALVRELRAQHVAAREHQHASLVRLRAASALPQDRALFDTIVVFEERELGDALGAQQCRLWSGGIHRSVHTHYGLTLAGYARPALSLEIAYRRRTFGDEAVHRMAGHLLTLLEAAAACPGTRCGDLEMLTPDERPRDAGAWAGVQVEQCGDTLPSLFEAQAERTPAARAIVTDAGALTYAELNDRANRLAHLLIAQGIGPEALVGVAMPRSVEAIVALIAILKAGGAYLPLDPDYPSGRLAFMIEDARAACVLTTSDVPIEELAGARRILLDAPAVRERLAAGSFVHPDVAIDPEHVAYCIYTSGSTGTPKGILVPHRAIANKIRTLIDYLGVGPSTRFAVTSSISFDPLLDQVFLPLCAGGTCVIVPDEVRDDPRRFAEYAEHTRISMLNGTPALVDRLLRESSIRLDTLVIGADTLQPSLAAELRGRGVARRILNFYGPTETCINASGYEIGEACLERSVPIGTALPAYRLHVLTGGLQPLPPHVAGELYIGGPGVARGYMRRPGLTAERFLPDPFGGPGARMYRTGDRARWRADGNLEFLGRSDQQVKVRGFRVEPGEVEQALLRHPPVMQAFVAAQPDASGDARLVAYVVPRPGASIVTDDLRACVRGTVPHFMVPSAFVALERLPLTPNGKVDRAALPARDLQSAATAPAPATPATELPQAIASICEEVLGVPRITPADNFFDLGGHSLSAMRVVSRVRERLHVDVPVRLLLDTVTLGSFADTVEQLRLARRGLPSDVWSRPAGRPSDAG